MPQPSDTAKGGPEGWGWWDRCGADEAVLLIRGSGGGLGQQTASSV